MSQISVVFYLTLIFMVTFTTGFAEDVKTEKQLLKPLKQQTEIQKLYVNKIDLNKIDILDLKTAGLIALSKNPSVAVAHARILQAQEYIHQAKAMYWPQLRADLSVSKTWMSNSEYNASLNAAKSLNPKAFINDTQKMFNTGLNIKWNVFDGFKSKFSNQFAKLGKNISEMSEKNVKRILLSNVANAYFFAQLANENIAIAKANKSFYKRQLEEAKIRRKIGTGSLSDELNFEIRYNDAKVTTINTEKSYQTALFSIAALLGIQDSTILLSKKLAQLKFEPSIDLSNINRKKLILYAMENRADILQQLLSIKQADADIKIAKADYYPRVDTSASLSGTRTDNINFRDEDFGHSISLIISYDIFSGGLRKAKVALAKAKLLEIKNRLKENKLDINTKIHSALTELKFINKELEIVRSTLALVKKQRNLVELEYNAGQCSLVRLNEAQRDLITAQSRLLLSLVTLNQTWYKLEAETGKIVSIFKL